MLKELEPKLREILGQLNGRGAVYLSVPDKQEVLTIDGDAVFRAASTIKVPLLVKLMKDAEEGIVDLEETRRVADVNRVGGSGMLQSMSPELRISVFDLALLMIVSSDNIATNEIIDIVSFDRANAFFTEMGWTDTHLGRKMMMKQVPDASGVKPENYFSAGTYGRILDSIAAGTMLSASVSEKIRGIMLAHRLDKIASVLPEKHLYDPRKPFVLPPEGKVTVACKGGTLDSGISHDGAIVYLPDGRYYVLVVMTETPDNSALPIIQRISRAVYEAVK